MRAAVLEHIVPDFGSSFRLLALDNQGPHCLNYWHYHPEYELVYIDRGSATRHIGNSLDRFENGDLILVDRATQGDHRPMASRFFRGRLFRKARMQGHQSAIRS